MGPHPGVVALGVLVLVAGRARGLGQMRRLHSAATEQQQDKK